MIEGLMLLFLTVAVEKDYAVSLEHPHVASADDFVCAGPVDFDGASELTICDVGENSNSRSSRRVQIEFPELRKRYWGRRFWARGYFSTTSGNVTDDIILQYLELHSKRDATGVSR